VHFRWNEPLGSRALLGLIAIALLVLVLSFRTSARPIEKVAGSDVTIYQAYGSLVLDGAMPYRDFDLEYPPGALAIFVPPATAMASRDTTDAASWSPPDRKARRYYRGFSAFVLLLLGVILVLTAFSLRAMRRTAVHTVLALGVVACSPLLLGQVLVERFDVLPAALVAAALAAGVRSRFRLAGALLGLGVATKFYPALLLPAIAIAAFRMRGRREALWALSIALTIPVAVYVPFALASPARTWESVLVQLRGGLQIETLSSSAWVLASRAADALGIGAFGLRAQGAGGGLIRFDLSGHGVEVVKTGTTVVLVAVTCWIWISFWRSNRDTREEMLRFSAATIAVLLVFGTILSPQYLTWLLPVVPLVGGRRGTAAIVAFAVAAFLTNLWIPDHYFDYQADLEVGPTSLLLARNLALLAVLVILLVPAHVLDAKQGTTPPPSAPKL
jgi:hypothetical protein